jgi:hypothetical protein
LIEEEPHNFAAGSRTGVRVIGNDHEPKYLDGEHLASRPKGPQFFAPVVSQPEFEMLPRDRLGDGMSVLIEVVADRGTGAWRTIGAVNRSFVAQLRGRSAMRLASFQIGIAARNS